MPNETFDFGVSCKAISVSLSEESILKTLDHMIYQVLIVEDFLVKSSEHSILDTIAEELLFKSAEHDLAGTIAEDIIAKTLEWSLGNLPEFNNSARALLEVRNLNDEKSSLVRSLIRVDNFNEFLEVLFPVSLKAVAAKATVAFSVLYSSGYSQRLAKYSQNKNQFDASCTLLWTGTFDDKTRFAIAYYSYDNGIEKLVDASLPLTTNSRPVLSWDVSQDLDSDQEIRYEINIAEDLDFRHIIFSEKNLNDVNYTFSEDLLLNKVYYWKVRAVNIYNSSIIDYSDWSNTASFQVVDSVNSSVPALGNVNWNSSFLLPVYQTYYFWNTRNMKNGRYNPRVYRYEFNDIQSSPVSVTVANGADFWIDHQVANPPIFLSAVYDEQLHQIVLQVEINDSLGRSYQLDKFEYLDYDNTNNGIWRAIEDHRILGKKTDLSSRLEISNKGYISWNLSSDPDNLIDQNLFYHLVLLKDPLHRNNNFYTYIEELSNNQLIDLLTIDQNTFGAYWNLPFTSSNFPKMINCPSHLMPNRKSIDFLLPSGANAFEVYLRWNNEGIEDYLYRSNSEEPEKNDITYRFTSSMSITSWTNGSIESIGILRNMRYFDISSLILPTNNVYHLIVEIGDNDDVFNPFFSKIDNNSISLNSIVDHGHFVTRKNDDFVPFNPKGELSFNINQKIFLLLPVDVASSLNIKVGQITLDDFIDWSEEQSLPSGDSSGIFSSLNSYWIKILPSISPSSVTNLNWKFRYSNDNGSIWSEWSDELSYLNKGSMTNNFIASFAFEFTCPSYNASYFTPLFNLMLDGVEYNLTFQDIQKSNTFIIMEDQNGTWKKCPDDKFYDWSYNKKFLIIVQALTSGSVSLDLSYVDKNSNQIFNLENVISGSMYEMDHIENDLSNFTSFDLKSWNNESWQSWKRLDYCNNDGRIEFNLVDSYWVEKIDLSFLRIPSDVIKVEIRKNQTWQRVISLQAQNNNSILVRNLTDGIRISFKSVNPVEMLRPKIYGYSLVPEMIEIDKVNFIDVSKVDIVNKDLTIIHDPEISSSIDPGNDFSSLGSYDSYSKKDRIIRVSLFRDSEGFLFLHSKFGIEDSRVIFSSLELFQKNVTNVIFDVKTQETYYELTYDNIIKIQEKIGNNLYYVSCRAYDGIDYSYWSSFALRKKANVHTLHWNIEGMNLLPTLGMLIRCRANIFSSSRKFDVPVFGFKPTTNLSIKTLGAEEQSLITRNDMLNRQIQEIEEMLDNVINGNSLTITW